jgi:hypothetical protein
MLPTTSHGPGAETDRRGFSKHAARPQRRVFAAYGDQPDVREKQRVRRRHPVLVEILASIGFLTNVAVTGYLVTHLGFVGFLVSLASGLAWGLMFTYGAPSWLQTDLQILRGHTRDELFPP